MSEDSADASMKPLAGTDMTKVLSLEGEERRRLIQSVTDDVVTDMGPYAYFDSWYRRWRPRRGPCIDAIVASTVRALERRADA